MAESVVGDVIAVFKYIPKGTSKCNIVKLKERVLISDMFVKNMAFLTLLNLSDFGGVFWEKQSLSYQIFFQMKISVFH